MKKTIAIDIDDVLSLFAEAFYAYSIKLFGYGLKGKSWYKVEAYFDR